MSDYWLADSEARVLGPVGVDVVRDLALRGKLADVRAVSRDGRNFVPLREVPEIQAALEPPRGDDAARAQADATRQIRDWLYAIKDRATHDVFKVDVNASREAYRAAFFTLVHRYVPSRLPVDATPELRLACEDAFLHLSERMVAHEAARKANAPPAVKAAAPKVKSESAQVTWRGGMVHVRLSLKRGDASPFTLDPEANFKTDGVYILFADKVMAGTPAEVTMAFEGHVTQVHGTGRVTHPKKGLPPGFGVKLLDLNEQQRSMIRTWVQRSQP